MKKTFISCDILLPKFAREPDKMTKYACIACDQYTSEGEYWADVENVVGDAPSTLRLTLPEYYLSDSEARIPKINETMVNYQKDILTCHKSSMIYLERTQNNGKIRRGIIGGLDLDSYDYNKGAAALTRATEGTVLERIPPRVKIREGASIELPHIMILIDDPECSVIEPLGSATGLETAYDFDLMKKGGHVSAKFLSDKEITAVTDALDTLTKKAATEQGCDTPLVYAVGDGNHSLASAKAYWEKIKPTVPEAEREDHPARYALCEIVNIHDTALEFEPIYRVVFGVDPDELLAEFEGYIASLPKNSGEGQRFEYCHGNTSGEIGVENPTSMLPVGTLQTFLDLYIKSHPGAEVDYIHGIDSTKKLAAGDNAIGFIFDGMSKSQVFKTVVAEGALPRKTLSMGEADDKRFYIEARAIR